MLRRSRRVLIFVPSLESSGLVVRGLKKTELFGL